MVSIESGTCMGFGATNARVGRYESGDITGFRSVGTPDNPTEFFGWMAGEVLQASERGDSWVVAGFPGPVSADGTLVGPMANVEGMSQDQYGLVAALSKADPAVGRLIEEGFSLIAVNDGELSAQAAAIRVGEGEHDRVADLIIGTGIGSGIVERDPANPEVYRSDPSTPAEIGHLLLFSDHPGDTFETKLSGPALERRYGIAPEEMDANHPAMHELSRGVCQLSNILGLMHGAELVVVSGGVGANASDKYGAHLERQMENYALLGNGAQKLYLPKVVPVPQEEAQVFELFGAEGVMRDFSTRS